MNPVTIREKSNISVTLRFSLSIYPWLFMQIHLNGTIREVADGATLATLVEQLELRQRRVAIEVNEELVPRTQHAARRLTAGDRVEIVHAIGGG